ncbi:GNAT family N-acetyltransferase [bacterium]|nr:GNAT family N-acetyltransferase [bacterium]
MDIRFIDDIKQIDFTAVTVLLRDMRWCKGITQAEAVFAAENSALVLAAYHGDALAGYLRVVSDRTFFAYIMDVVIMPDLRGQGIGSAMIGHARGHVRLKYVYQWMLRTPDAQGFYAKQGFRPLANPEQWMLIQDNRPENRESENFDESK